MSISVVYYVETANDAWTSIHESFYDSNSFCHDVASTINNSLANFPEQFEKINFWKKFALILLNNKDFAIHVKSVSLLSILSEAGKPSEQKPSSEYLSAVMYTDYTSVEDLTHNLANLSATENESC